MQSKTPKQQAIIIALLVAIFSSLAGLTIFLFDEANYLISLLFVGLLVFLSVFLIVFYSFNNFIIHKLKPIYKTIQSIHYSDKRFKQGMDEMDKDLIKEAQADVLIWAKRKTNEIAQLRQLEKYRREFLGNVSHELKTPIFNIQGYVSTLLDGGLHDETVNMLYLERTDKSVNRLISIVNDLESISRLESGELKLEMENFNVISLVEEVFDELELQAKERHIKLQIINTSDKPVMVFGDKRRIQDVLNNLVVNSIKYGRNKGTTNIEFFDMVDQVLIEVSDNGIGISEKDLPRIFERFYRTDKSRSRELGGTGLGLAIVKHIIEAHNQHINVRSDVNKGSAFSFTLMRADS
jgi:two-component system, OmpR family, phosphate regulon sensor histidine kinase PhoR